MALMGAEVLLYPTAIGSEPHDPTLDTPSPGGAPCRDTRVERHPGGGRQPHGFEPWDGYPNGGQTFYGSSFIADHRGDLVAELGRDDEGAGGRHLRPRLPGPTAPPGASSATGGRTSTARWSIHGPSDDTSAAT
jgi:hypothetical protein